MFVTNKKAPFISLYFFRCLALTIHMITLVQSFKSPSNKNIGNTLNINSHSTRKPTPKFENWVHMNYSWREPVLFKKLHNIKLSCSVFRVTTFFQFGFTKSALNSLIKYAQDLDENLKTLYSKIVMNNNNYDHKSYEANQWNYILLSLTNMFWSNFRLQTPNTNSNVQISNIFTTFDQSKHNCMKRGIIHSLFNFSFDSSSSTEEITAIKTIWKY